MFGYESLHLYQSASGRASERTVMLGSFLQAKHRSSNSFGWVPAHGMDSMLGWSLVSHFFSFCSIFVPEFLLDKSFGVKCSVGWLLSPFLHWGSCVATEVFSLGSISLLLGIFS